MAEGRFLGLDYGDKTVGVAVSDPLMLTAQGVEIIRREKPTKLRRTLARIAELCEEYQVSRIVLGLPKNMDGSEGIRCEKTREFMGLLSDRVNCEIVLWDERLTTVQADRTMEETGVKKEHFKDHVDEIAAMLILQNYMDSLQ